jgi:hypothetical protein
MSNSSLGETGHPDAFLAVDRESPDDRTTDLDGSGSEGDRLHDVDAAADAAVDDHLGSFTDPSAIAARASIAAGAVSSCRPPWLDTTTPAAPASTARTASSGRTIPLTKTGRWLLIDANHSTSSHVRVGSKSASIAALNEEFDRDSGSEDGASAVRFGFHRPSGSAKLFRISRSRRPRIGVSAVSSSAEQPAASTRFTSASLAARSLVELEPHRAGRYGDDVFDRREGEAAEHEDRTGRRRRAGGRTRDSGASGAVFDVLALVTSGRRPRPAKRLPAHDPLPLNDFSPRALVAAGCRGCGRGRVGADKPDERRGLPGRAVRRDSRRRSRTSERSRR